ncbi:partitioning defective 3 homolog isoform X2 [Lutzomyia longipalpis]|uniref:partitioning defective 3 homolog isoform X2 n=1 Tax=Lutzomyia longipalpis TaxID=7200 RepID=UPI002483E267|nr:partitioning defective 3 homolog isoform X2 [Lutzomyia longipalpis]XP_055683383.1 partitioning defective 3 homolog isoform X2 [Lutzomyia longipalpis]XP_055683384.1 partitioning defective 3 homolog isoform X2 [Lutzomyia longipalpis]XP_055683385.1 partitioning defective 3 homolog isoform X2 [Lutzomyia longipalpis]XP_055683386.1 partitioning defective 3 homolog isoform X2 [Lutzomyia longipalpis]
MKVTVSFGTCRIVVPCGNGDLLVKDLIDEAIRRYKKASGKDPHSWVVVHHLQSQSGILDPDDCVSDVADDREQILASFDDCPEPNVPQGGGDGASGSSVGTGSPDIFRGVNGGNLKRVYPDEAGTQVTELAKYSDNASNGSRSHIEVTDSVSPLGLGLQVRRSSDPSIPQTLAQSECNQRSPLCQCPTHEKQQQESMKRWSAAPVCRRDTDSPAERILTNVVNNAANYLTPPTAQWPEPLVEAAEPHGTSPGTSFSRSGRLSMQFLGETAPGYRWMEAAEKAAANMNQSTSASFNSKSLPRDLKRKEPLGQAYESMRDKRDTEMLLVINEQGGGPLGLTAIPDLLNGGLLVQSVEPGSRAERGRLQKGDRILEINGTKLAGMSENNLQSYLKKSLSSTELRFRVSTANRNAARRNEGKDVGDGEYRIPAKVATVSPNRKTAGTPATNSLQVANTRKLGRRIEIALKKGGHGLGFSVTTRDNPTGGHCPIYIKNILPRGAAIESGKLKPGDRLLEVDGIAMTGKTQSEVVSILRATQLGATVNIVVSRQSDLEEIDEREVRYEMDKENNEGTPPKPPPPVLPQKPQKSPSVKSLGQSEGKNSLGGQSTNSSSAESSAGTLSWKNREIITLHIPVHDTERAGLGVSVKGKTGSSGNGSFNRQTDGDLGIFVKSVLHGGAASRDGRLKMNDQLLSVNGVSLLGQSNADAMETLRRAMLHTGGKFPGVITLSVARKISRPSSMGDLLEVATGSNDRANATVIYLNCEPQKNRKEENTVVEMWNNPVVERLTGGVEMKQPMASSSPYTMPGLRNESYYMATKDTSWSPLAVNSNHINNRNNSILIEEDSEPTSPTLPNRPQYQSMASADSNATLTSGDVTYSSQLSLEPPTGEAFSRDAIGRRSISEKHHAALDAKETGTYQRNKKLREDRERERKAAMAASGSVDSLGKMGRDAIVKKVGSNSNVQHASEAMDRVTDLGPSLGLKKSSSLESLQTMVHEIQMADEPRGPVALRTPRGRGREEILRAAVECPPENESRKQWLLDYDGPAINRNSPLQSSVSSGKQKRSGSGKKSSLLKGIGHMFRFGKHRKDGIAPAETMNTFDGHQKHSPQKRELPPKPYSGDRPLGGPPGYQPPPAPIAETSTVNNDHFFQRYRPGFKYDDHQEQMSSPPPPSDQLSESTLTQMRQQVMHQRVKVEEESRNHQQYQSQRSTRTVNAYPVRQNSSRPISSYYEYETLQFPTDSRSECGWKGGAGAPVAGRGRQWNGVGGSTRSRGPFVTQVTIRQPQHPNKTQNSQPSSKV